MNTICFYYIRL